MTDTTMPVLAPEDQAKDLMKTMMLAIETISSGRVDVGKRVLLEGLRFANAGQPLSQHSDQDIINSMQRASDMAEAELSRIAKLKKLRELEESEPDEDGAA